MAFENAQSGTTKLVGFDNTTVLTLGLRPDPTKAKDFIVWGRVVIRNLDGSAQNASATMTTTAKQIDRVDVRIAGDDSSPDPGQSGGQTLSLLATLRLTAGDPDNSVQLICATYNGVAQQGQLIAIEG
jgi:hypothetical protein